MKYSDNVLNILAAKSYKGIGNAWIVKKIQGNESVDRIVSLINLGKDEDFMITSKEFIKQKERISAKLSSIKNCDGAIALGDKEFPKHRGKVKDSARPVVLFYKGDISLLNTKNLNIGVIGMLEPDEYIKQKERNVLAQLLEYNATIVSGLALGCDSIAHIEAVNNNGKTIAILPNTLDKIMPSSNEGLARKIIETGGLLITEYYEDFNSQKEMISRYIERDRLQALFSDGIVLSASYTKNNLGNDSGSRHAMQYAKEYNIARAVIYDAEKDVDNEKFALNKQIHEEDNSVEVIQEDSCKSTIARIISQIKKIKGQSSTEQLSLF